MVTPLPPQRLADCCGTDLGRGGTLKVVAVWVPSSRSHRLFLIQHREGTPGRLSHELPVSAEFLPAWRAAGAPSVPQSCRYLTTAINLFCQRR